MDDEEFKVFLRVIILIGVYKSNNESVEQLPYGAHLRAGPFSITL